MSSRFAIGTAVEALIPLDELGVPEPKTTYRRAQTTVELANGNVRALGAPSTEWTFGILTQSQRDQLRVFCSGFSAKVYIRTRTDEADESGIIYDVYEAIMHWPEQEDYDTAHRLNLTLLFKRLERIEA